MRHLRRLLGWAVFLGFLSALSAGVFYFVRYRPRCTIVGPLLNIARSADGSRLVTLNSNDNALHGPLQVWDTFSGRVVDKWFTGARVNSHSYSPDGRHLGISLDDGLLRLVDWRAGREWSIEEPKRVDNFYFSPQGRWLFIRPKASNGDVVLDTKTRQITLRMEESLLSGVPDERWAFTRKLQADREIGVWDLTTAKKVGSIQSELDHVCISPDGKTAVSWVLDDKTDRAEAGRMGMRIPDRGMDVWSLPTGRKRFRLDFPIVGVWRAVFSPDSQVLATWLEFDARASKLEMRSVENGRILWDTTVTCGYHGEFAPDSKLFLFSQAEKEPLMTMFDAATGRKLWERPGPERTKHFLGDTGILLRYDEQTQRMLFLDVRTGEQKVTGTRGFCAQNDPVLTSDRRHFVVGGHDQRNRRPLFGNAWLEGKWPHLFGGGLARTLVMESATGRELFHVTDCGGQWRTLSDDAGTLITADSFGGTWVIRVWDVPSTKAWLWAVGVALGTGLVLRLLVFRWVRAFRNRKKVAGGPTMKHEGEQEGKSK